MVYGGVRNVITTGKEGQREIQLRVHHQYSCLKPDLAWDILFWVALSFILGTTAWVGVDSLSFLVCTHIHLMLVHIHIMK